MSITALAIVSLASPVAQGSFLPDPPAWEVRGTSLHEGVGTRMCAAGDVNGDGHPDVFVLTPTNGGTAHADLYHGTPSGFSATPSWTVTESRPQFGPMRWDVVGAGDLNGDGCDDIALASENSGRGAVSVFYGSSAGPNGGVNAEFADGDWIAVGSLGRYRALGYSLAGIGDVNGDGHCDLAVGAPFHRTSSSTAPNGGAVVIYRGSSTGLVSTMGPATGDNANWILESQTGSMRLGERLHAIGDMNTDGYADFVVTSMRGLTDNADFGRHWIYMGSPSGPAAGLGGAFDSIGGGDQGIQMSLDLAAGDFNQDGFGDVVIGHPGQISPTGREPLELHYGTPGGLVPSGWRLTGSVEGLGLALTAGDFDGDTWLDLAVSSTSWVGQGAGRGRVQVFQGRDPANSLDGRPLASNSVWFHELGQAAGGHFPTFLDTLPGMGIGFPEGLLLSVPREGSQPAWNAGRVALFRAPQPVLEACPQRTPDWTLAGTNRRQAGSFGVLGDFNGDGFDDALLGGGRPHWGPPEIEMFAGSALGLASEASWSAQISMATVHHGPRPVATGDVNDDGFTDALVIAPGDTYWPSGSYSDRAAFVFLGGQNGLGSAPVWRADFVGPEPSHFAHCGALLDLNGDGFDDVVIGAPGWEQLPALFGDPWDVPGAVYAWYGSANGVHLGVNGNETNSDWHATHAASEARFGTFVRSAGDLNGDGCEELLVGAPGVRDSATVTTGATYLWFGAAAGPNGGVPGTNSNAAQELRGDPGGGVEGDRFDAGLDLTGDGISDLVLATTEGFELHPGTATGFAVQHTLRVSREDRVAFGTNVAIIPDFDGDGIADVVATTSYSNGGAVQDGRVDLFRGAGRPGADAIDPAPVWRGSGKQAFARLGFNFLSASGDVNGDGLSDLLTGAPFWDAPGGDENGLFMVWHGTRDPLLTLQERSAPAGATVSFGLVGYDGDAKYRLIAKPGRTPGLQPIGAPLIQGMTDPDGCALGSFQLPAAMTPGEWRVIGLVRDDAFPRGMRVANEVRLEVR